MKNNIFFFICIFLFSACKHELERPTWDVDLLVPLIHSQMSIDDIDMLSDSAITINEDEDGFITLVFQEKFTDINLDTLIDIKDTLDVTKVVLDSMTFKDISITETSRLGELLGPLGRIAFPHLDTMNIPDMPGLIQGKNIPIDASEHFESMTFHKGYLRINLYNGFPTELANVDISLVDANNNNTIASFNFPSIPSISHVTDSVFLGGMSINKDLIAILNNIDVLASSAPVIINHWDAIVLTIEIIDISLTDATAIFPAQQVAEIIKEHPFSLGNARITEIKIKEGTVTVNSTSTLPDTGRIYYNIPSLTLGGNTFSSLNIVPPSNNGEYTSYKYNLDGYILDLKGKQGRSGGDTVNTIYTEFFAFIDSSGGLVHLNQTDSFFSYTDIDIIPEYARGFLGQDTIKVGPEERKTNVFNKILSGDLDLESAKLAFNIRNYLGADLQIKFDQLSTYNSSTNTTVSAGFNFLSQFHNITRATEMTGAIPIVPSITDIELDAESMLEILPNKLKSKMTLYVNPFGPGNISDFLYPAYTIDATLNLEIPLSIIANNLTLVDTNEVEVNQNDEVEIDKLFLTIKNGIPFDATLNVMLYDEMDNLIDTLFNNAILLSAKVDENNLVTQSTTSTLTANYNNSGKIRKVITVASFNTQANNSFVKIYSDYKMDITMSAKLRKTIGN